MSQARIVSLVPSLTQTVCGFGLRSSLVGCTNFCIDPVGLHRSAKMIGGTKDPDLIAIEALKPTHIIVNEEENTPAVISACRSFAPTFVTFPKAPHTVPAMLRDLGDFLGAQDEGQRGADACLERLADLAELVGEKLAAGTWERRRYLYFIWRNPWMTVSRDTYISSMLDLVGFVNAAPIMPRYPTVTAEEILTSAADVVFLSSEPWTFRERDRDALCSELIAASASHLSMSRESLPTSLKADGKLFSWYGLVLIEALDAMISWVEGGPQDLVKKWT